MMKMMMMMMVFFSLSLSLSLSFVLSIYSFITLDADYDEPSEDEKPDSDKLHSTITKYLLAALANIDVSQLVITFCLSIFIILLIKC